MHNLKQANRDFSTYLAEFLRIAPDTEYDDNTKLAALREGLSHELRMTLMNIMDKPDTFDEYVTLLQKIDSKQQAEKHRVKSYTPRTVNTPRVNTGNNTSFASIVRSSSINPPSVPATQPVTTMTGTHPGPMDLSSGRFQKLSQEEKDRRTREGLCQYCGGAGHIARVCPNIGKPKPIRIAELDVSSNTEKAENI